MKMKPFFTREDGMLIRIDLSMVVVLEADGKYLKLHLPGKHFLLPISIDKGISALGAEKFCKTSRSYAVSVPDIEAIGRDVVTVAGTDIPLAKPYYKRLLSRVHVLDKGF